jgi:hypothetical protein
VNIEGACIIVLADRAHVAEAVARALKRKTGGRVFATTTASRAVRLAREARADQPLALVTTEKGRDAVQEIVRVRADARCIMVDASHDPGAIATEVVRLLQGTAPGTRGG